MYILADISEIVKNQDLYMNRDDLCKKKYKLKIFFFKFKRFNIL